jgi:hypothetical protein
MNQLLIAHAEITFATRDAEVDPIERCKALNFYGQRIVRQACGDLGSHAVGFLNRGWESPARA